MTGPSPAVKVKGQPHHFQWKQQVGEDDGRIDVQEFGGSDGDFGCQFGLLADLDQRVMLAHVAILLHVAPSLAHKPDRSGINRKPLAGTYKERIGGGHKETS